MNYSFNKTELQPKGKPIVYWIHTPEQKDMYSEGYIGITKNPAKQRWVQHLACTKNNRKNNKLYEVLKDEDNLIFDVVAVGETREYCEHIEHSLRPTPYIGWNTAPGGNDGYTQVGGQINKERWKQKKPDRDANRWYRSEMMVLRLLFKQQKELDRIASLPSRNHGKRKVSKRNKSGYTGVNYYPKYGMWRSMLCIDYKNITLGYFDTQDIAHKAYIIAKSYVPTMRATGINTVELKAFIRKQIEKNMEELI